MRKFLSVFVLSLETVAVYLLSAVFDLTIDRWQYLVEYSIEILSGSGIIGKIITVILLAVAYVFLTKLVVKSSDAISESPNGMRYIVHGSIVLTYIGVDILFTILGNSGDNTITLILGSVFSITLIVIGIIRSKEHEEHMKSLVESEKRKHEETNWSTVKIDWSADVMERAARGEDVSTPIGEKIKEYKEKHHIKDEFDD